VTLAPPAFVRAWHDLWPAMRVLQNALIRLNPRV
jgi:hypothetical protein